MMNRKYIGIVAAILLGSPLQTVVASEIYSLSHGTVKVVLTTIGELVVCDPTEQIVRLDFTYKFLRGVCDDRGDIRCNGRVTGITERCTDDVSEGYVSGGFTSTYTGPVPLRLCFDEGGSCTVVDRVASGRLVRNHNAFFPGEATADSNSESEIRRSKIFIIDGRRVRVERGTETANATFEQAVGTFGSPENCLLAGCGFVSTTIK